MNPPEENILVIKRSLFDQLGSFHGLNFEPRRYLDALLSRGNNFFLPRAQAENDPTHKQIVPYAILAFKDKVLYYVRGKKAGEQRLVAKGSIGIGGHMNESDESLFARSEEHTSELQSHSDLVCRLLLEKKKMKSQHAASSF